MESGGKSEFFLPKRGHAEGVARSWRKEKPDLDLSDFLLGVYLMRLGRVTEQYFGRVCETRFGVRGPDMRVLLALRRGGAPFARRPTDLFQALLVTSGAMTKQIDRLVEFGAVERRPDPDYRGGFLVGLTDQGMEMADAATDVFAKTAGISLAMKALDPQEREAGERFCFKLLDALERVGVPSPAQKPPRKAGKARKGRSSGPAK